MMSSDYLQQYTTLLRIRQTAARRNVIIAGVIFGACTFVLLMSNLYIEPNNRSLFLNAILIVCFGLGFVFAWSRFDTISGIIEFVDVLRHEAKEQPYTSQAI
jgi:hypothetical protein